MNDEFGPLSSGCPSPLGATWKGGDSGAGANFALFSENATMVELCLFDATGEHEIARLALPECTHGVWHGHLENAQLGQLYGYRVYGPYAPEQGHRFNPNKLLIDPYAKALHGRIVHHDANYAYDRKSPLKELSFDTRDNACYMPKAVLVDLGRPKPNDQLKRPWTETIIYELHVKGMTQRHPEVEPQLRGTLKGLASEPVIHHLQGLGITAIELMPIHPFTDEPHLVEKGLTNYWGYSPYSFFTPDPRYIHQDGMADFAAMVDRFHEAGIEVIMDVVYNHTGEGGNDGPTYSLRGIDNASYYRLDPDNPLIYVNDTGCGNTLDLHHPYVLQMVMDSLRHWVEYGHVDGFRFDLASSLARTEHSFSSRSAFLAAIAQDPVLSTTKLIAEPWDLGHGGYQLGQFPSRWMEWNDRYRNTLRRYWRGDQDMLKELAFRVSGSNDLFETHRRNPLSSINFITAHDGFTLNDLVSFNRKHNEKNGENNHDGTDNNISWNCGIEGPSEMPKTQELRLRQKRNFIASLLLSQGVPMLLAGDELGRSQNGNNNAYCQDNEISWLDWSPLSTEDSDFLNFISMLVHFRLSCPAFRRKNFFSGSPIGPGLVKDITWLSPDGREMTDEDWHLPYAKCLGFHLPKSIVDGVETTSRFMVLINADENPVKFRLPPAAYGGCWRRVVDTAYNLEDIPQDKTRAGSTMTLQSRNLILLSGKIDKKRKKRRDT